MTALDLITHIKSDLNDKREGWSNDDLLIKLQRCYKSLQTDLPFFRAKENLAIQKDIVEYTLQKKPIKHVSFRMSGTPVNFIDQDTFDVTEDYKQFYTFDEDRLVLRSNPIADTTSELVYRYIKPLIDINSEIETPDTYDKALRLLFLSDIHEKPIMSTDFRDMSVHYLKLYNTERDSLKKNTRLRPNSAKSNYQAV